MAIAMGFERLVGDFGVFAVVFRAFSQFFREVSSNFQNRTAQSQLGIMKASLVSFLAALEVLLLQFAIEGLGNLFTC